MGRKLDADVIIVGAGPTGLMLAAELRLGGASVIVTEQLEQSAGQSRALGFTTRALESFDQRGLLPRFGTVETSPMGHFGGIPFDYTVLEDANFGARGIPQSQTEAVLEEWARELGANIRRGHEFLNLAQDEEGVTITVRSPQGERQLHSLYVVGADGAHSPVRKAAHIDFPGTPGTQVMHLADVTGTDVRPRPFGERLPTGLVQTFPVDDTTTRIILSEYNTPLDHHTETPTFSDIAAAWHRVTGEDITTATPHWTSSFTDATRQAATYRDNRVLLAGDAAHIHLPVGGQGMSTGIQDAVNLGWKLAGTTQGWAPAHLLDTYHDERHPVGQRLLTNTRAQGQAIFGGDQSQALRDLFAELLTLTDVQKHLAGTISHTDIRYTTPGTDANPLTGHRLPPRTLNTTTGPTHTTQLLHSAHMLLITPTTTPQPNTTGWKDRLTTITTTAPHPHPLPDAPLLIRPDGYIAYVGTDPDQLTQTLHHWLGAPDPA
ncbi:FAD-dependent monooxygenase [Streptomyces sp. NPDC005728]|uniref:FAD-dependent monooxygenase n=1 Tax=Streptomyces sp. NPDC005728 TaxID=3157054 RepID=UPI0033EDAD31